MNAQGLTHTAPKPASNGAVTFKFGWQAPAKAGAVDVHVAALAGNGNNASSGDSPGTGDFQWVFGCTATTFYADLDRDGYGSKSWGTRLGCVGDAAADRLRGRRRRLRRERPDPSTRARPRSAT